MAGHTPDPGALAGGLLAKLATDGAWFSQSGRNGRYLTVTVVDTASGKLLASALDLARAALCGGEARTSGPPSSRPAPPPRRRRPVMFVLSPQTYR